MIEFIGNIEDFWTKDLESFVFPQLSSAGQRNSFHKNYSKSNNDLQQAFDEEIPNFLKFSDALNLYNASISWTSIEPGQTIPVHTDSFYKLRSKYNVDINKCVRYLIFLQNWELGHFVEFDNFELKHWKKGNVYKFDYLAKHCAANASNIRFVTCQVNAFDQ
jgi:hypothetical protein